MNFTHDKSVHQRKRENLSERKLQLPTKALEFEKVKYIKIRAQNPPVRVYILETSIKFKSGISKR